MLEVQLLAEENIIKMADLNVKGQDDAALWAANRKSKWQPTTEPKERYNGAKGGSGDTRKPQCGFCTKLNHRSSHHEDSCWRKEMYEKGKRDATRETALAAESVQKKRPVSRKRNSTMVTMHIAHSFFMVMMTNGMWITEKPST